MKKVFKLGYIHCAGCSVALQDKISEVENVKSVNINFVTKLVKAERKRKFIMSFLLYNSKYI